MRRPGCAICLGVAVGLLASAPALAARSATAPERRAITHAAAIADGSPTQRVRVTNIKVSTAGPWATATVAIYLKRTKTPEMVSEETFFRLHGRWWDTTDGNAPQRTAPAAVVSDLGLPGSGDTASNVGHIIAYVFIGLLVLGVLALIGKISSATSAGAEPGGGGRTSSSGPQPFKPQYGTKPSEKCRYPACRSGKVMCHICHGRGSIQDPQTSQFHPCPGPCMRTGWVNCPRCNGKGTE